MISKLVAAMLIANILYFIWAMTLGNTAYSPPPPNMEGVASIELLPITSADSYKSKGARGQSSCYTLGPFNSKEIAQRIAAKINNFGLATEIRKQKTMQTLNFFVYLEALPSREEAERIIKDMSQNEIKKYSIVETGPYKNAIALGSFEDLDKARRHSEYVRYLGYDAKYTAQKVQKEVYWISYDEPFSSNAPVLKWTKQIDPRASVQKIPKACDF